ncbi:transcription elongation factor GreAB [Burkholderia singularis]|uniref:Regulator of nucleoside diphosphate kinase n=1 Tax=Burkholderia singularis TaxID=1503053 RepID=A0A103E4Z6_9BURK|nr:GreA/GreB family elongation factor [Burkholderia singularis]KVE28455.1 transcription elongation factor GreAB [Burkholderia singularis]SMG00021.1 Regulator of nucleoside diphosphate kinase [Burkholderia singularis]
MKKRIYQLTELDVARLERHAERNPHYQAMLDTLLERADIVESPRIRANVVTMNSQVSLIDKTSGQQMTWTIVYPDAADFAQGHLNVFSPVGIALLGARRGEHVTVASPDGGTAVLTINEILYQPEASGDYAH